MPERDAEKRASAAAAFDAGNFEAAADEYERIAAQRPDPGDLVNLGYARLFLGRLEEARASFEGALAQQAAFAPALTGLGDLWARGGAHAEAATCYRRALGSDPALAVAHINLSLSLTALGELESAWREAEWRYELPQARSYYPRGKLEPRWDGRALGDRRLLVHWEQGFGDIVQHLRFVPLLATRAPNFVFECPPPMLQFARAALGAPHVVESSEVLPAFDVCAPLLSLPLLLSVDPQALPRPPYLSVDTGTRTRLRQIWSGDGRRLVGMAWRSSSFDPGRDVALTDLLALAGPQVRLVSLQKETTLQEREALRACGAIEAGSGFVDFADTTATIAALDAVVSVDTVVAHIAGALDRPTWLLLSEPAAVRWMIQRDDTPWYPAMRLLRRAPGRAWTELLAVAAAGVTGCLR